VRATEPAPVDDAGRHMARRRLEEVYPAAPGAVDLPGPDEIDGVLLVAAWFRRHKEERARGIDTKKALARARNNSPGGK
jgi:hypothetical protein